MYPGLLITRRIRIRRILRIIEEEIRYGFSTDVCRFRYPLGKAISGKKNIILDRESLIIKR